MWKRIGKKFRLHHGSSSVHPTGADFGDKVFLERHCTHGFPLAPSCLTFDEHRRLLMIGTSSGEIRILGQPGVELTGVHDDINKVLQILPFASEPSFITVCANNILHKWSFVDSEGSSRLIRTRTYKFQGGLAKKITTCCLPQHGDCLFVGTLGGITYPIDTEFDGMSPEVLSWSRARAYLDYKGKDVPGEVRTLMINPSNTKQLLIAYVHNYLELWDALSWKPISYYGAYKGEDVEDILSATWQSAGSQFVTAHNNGAIAFWAVENTASPLKVQKPYGSEPVQAMLDILWPAEDLLVISGGSPVSLVDTNSVTLIDHDKNYTLQLTSSVKGIHVLDNIQADRDSGIVNYADSADGEGMLAKQRVLILLLEQEILFIDLSFPELPLLRPPYLYSIHNSPTKCLEVYEDVPKDCWQTIAQAGRVLQDGVYHARGEVWPIDGGLLQHPDSEVRSLLVTGHEDGSLKFWDISTVSMKLSYILKTSHFFSSFDSDFFDSGTPENEQDNVKQVCFWDPRSDDDDQVQISCLQFHNDEVLVGFRGGMLLLFHLNKQSSSVTIPLHRISILRDDPRQRGRNWQAPMELRLDNIECAPGYQPSFCVGIFPNVPVSAIGFAKEQKLVGVGCTYGFTIVDVMKSTTVHILSTFTEVVSEQSHLSRMQSIRKSFRQSLKRLNVRRSLRGGQSTQRSFRPSLVRSGSTRPSMKHRTTGAGASPATSAEPTPMPPRRDSIRFITFSAPCQLARHASTPCLLVGTNQGGILAFTIEMPAEKQRESRSPIVMPIEREFNARRNYAVVFSGVIDHHNYLLDINDPGSYHHSSTKGGQWVVIVTEDAIKVMGLPSLKKKFRVRLKQSDSDEFHVQYCHCLRIGGQSYLAMMCSDGFVHIYSLPDLKLVGREDCVDASDAFGQRNFVVTSRGLFLHLRSPSEFTRGSFTEQARLNYNFSIPTKSTTAVASSAARSMSREIISDLPEPEVPGLHQDSAELSGDKSDTMVPIMSITTGETIAGGEDSLVENTDGSSVAVTDSEKRSFEERAL